MKVRKLLNGISYEIIQGTEDTEIYNIFCDSRIVTSDSLFICVKCKNSDGHSYAGHAVFNGARVLLVEHEIDNIPDDITVVKVSNTRAAMAHIANIYFMEPSRKFNLVGITGTNGKTSVSWFIEKILKNASHNVGVITTIENRIGEKILKTPKHNPTTPDSIELQSSFFEMINEGVEDVVIEVTSSALDKHRVDMCDFDIGVFTNLTQDHLDEHGTFENYKNAKMRLFRMCKHGIINEDDPVSKEIKALASCKILTYGINNCADFMAKKISYYKDSVSFTLFFNGYEKNVVVKTPGKFTVYNALAATSSCYLLGLSMDEIADGLSCINGVPGRFEAIPNTKGIMVVVDYAHTPDALLNVLSSAKELGVNKVITVFGCGGNRDKSKRPLMGEAAGRLSDLCIITSDNPRDEEPDSIIKDIEFGIKNTDCQYEKISDRREAIFKALREAREGDIVIIAGKGHETYQIIGNRIIHFSDSEVVNDYFNN